MASIDDGGLRAFVPVTGDFVNPPRERSSVNERPLRDVARAHMMFALDTDDGA